MQGRFSPCVRLPGAWGGYIAIVALLSACAGGGNETSPEEFDVPARPESFVTGAGLNQAPPPAMLVPEFARRSFGRPVPLSEEARQRKEAEALALARAWLADNGFGPDDDVTPSRVLPDEYGSVHVKMHQTYRGVPVLGAGLVAHLYPDLEDEVTDNAVRDIDLDVTPAIPESQAVADALSRYGRAGSMTLTTDARRGILPRFEWVRVASEHRADHTDDFEYRRADIRLVWEVVVQPEMPDLADVLDARLRASAVGTEDDATGKTRAENATRGGNESPASVLQDFADALSAPAIRYRFDAMSGELLEEQPLVQQIDFTPAKGQGYGYFSGRVPLDTARSPHTGNYLLNDLTRPLVLPQPQLPNIGNMVWDANNLEAHDLSDMTLFLDANNIWGDALVYNSENSPMNSPRRQTPAVDVAYGVQMTWDFFDNVLGRWGPAGDGTRTQAAVHYGEGYIDAHYHASNRFIVFGDGSAIEKPGNYAMATVGHELGHAFWHAVGNGGGKGEPAALNEGNSDILGALVDMYHGTGLGEGYQVRRFPLFASWRWRVIRPETYMPGNEVGQKYWSATLKDMKSPHAAGLPYARAFVYLAEGAPGSSKDPFYTAEFPGGFGGIGITRAAHVWMTAVAYYIVGEPNYVKMRSAFVTAAKYLYGEGSMVHRAARRAFAAIRVGTGPKDVADPEITYAQIWDVDTTAMTAKFLVLARDDTGIRRLRIDGHGNLGVYTGDWLYGYVNISRAPLGKQSFTFTIEDGTGRSASEKRRFVKSGRINLLSNGDFESGMQGWNTDSGIDRVGDDPERAFIGRGYARMEGVDTLWREVTIPAEAKDVRLAFRLLIRDPVKYGQRFEARVLSSEGDVQEILETYDWQTPREGRNALDKGYMGQVFNLDAYTGQTIRIAFRNETPEDVYNFYLDQVVLTYTVEPSVGLPEVILRPWENTVTFFLPQIEVLSFNDIRNVVYYVDNQVVAVSDIAPSYPVTVFLDDLGNGAHWVGARLYGHDGEVIAQSQGVWFQAGQVNELLVNGDFEENDVIPWDLDYSDPPPFVQVIEDQLDASQVFDGQRSLLMGGQGSSKKTEVGQIVQMPPSMKTLDFSVRVRVLTEEVKMDLPPYLSDTLRLELLDPDTFEKLGEYQLATYRDAARPPVSRDTLGRYRYVSVSIPPHKVRARKVLVRLQTREDASRPTWFYVDNASLRYTTFGLSLAPPPPDDGGDGFVLSGE